MAGPITDEARRDWIQANIESDLNYLLEDAMLPLDLHYRIGMAYPAMRLFRCIADSAADLRAALIADFGLDPAAQAPAGAANRRHTAAIISCWEASRDYMVALNRMRAEAAQLQVPRRVNTTERQAMRKSVEAVFGRIPTSETPSNEYLSTKLEELEQDEPTASTSATDSTGRIILTKAKSKGKLPSTSEELRYKLRVEGWTWMLLSAKFKNRAYMLGLTTNSFNALSDYVLGDKVLELKIPIHGILGHLSPDWAIILQYELQLRRHAFKAVREDGRTINDAIQAAIRDTETKELFFTTPLALSGKVAGVKRTSSHMDVPAVVPGADRPPRKGKGKGKGKGKSKKTSWSGQLRENPANGKPICYAFNSLAGCHVVNCPREHICRKPGCGAAHSITTHNRAA